MTAASLQRTLADLAKVPQKATHDAGKEVERIAREIGASVGAVSLGKKGRRVKLRAITRRAKASGNEASCTVYGVPTGPWVWVSSGTGTHVIPKQRSRGKQRTTRYLKGDKYEHPYGLAVIHPGASGKGAWRKVRRRAEVAVPTTVLKSVRKVVR